MENRVPPQNIDAEKAVIGSILIDNSVIDKVIDLLTADSFYDPKHNLIFEAIYELYRGNSPVDVLTLTNELKKKKKLKQSGGPVYLSEIVSGVPTSANAKKYAEIVKEMAVRRELISFAAKLDEISRVETTQLDELFDQVEGGVLGISQKGAKTDLLNSQQLLEMQMQKADDYARNPDALRGTPTGLNNLDKILNGLHNSDLIILAARPGGGKSAMAVHLARNAAVNHGKSVLLFTLEMPGIQVIERMLAQQMQVDSWKLRMGKLSEDEVKRYPEASGKIGDAKIYVSDTASVNIMQLRSIARKVKMEQGLDFIVIDYLQLMSSRDIENRAQAVGEISRSLKILARELNVPVLALSQLNRGVESRTRTDKTPQLSDLRESGSIEQDADIVIFLSREFNPDEEDSTTKLQEKVKVIVNVAKHRNGAVGSTTLEFIAPQQRFIDV